MFYINYTIEVAIKTIF